MSPDSQPNGENSQVRIFEYLYSILYKVDPQLLLEAGYDMNVAYTKIVYELIKERHGFLADMSDKYHAYQV